VPRARSSQPTVSSLARLGAATYRRTISAFVEQLTYGFGPASRRVVYRLRRTPARGLRFAFLAALVGLRASCAHAARAANRYSSLAGHAEETQENVKRAMEADFVSSKFRTQRHQSLLRACAAVYERESTR
jgi:hypothetical protein